MRCAFKCSLHPAIGIANVEGNPDSHISGQAGSYPLCHYHYTELIEGRWNTVTLVGWEPLFQGDSK